MKLPKILLKIIKYTAGSFVLVLLLMFLFPLLFPEFIEKEVKAYANQHIDGKLDFESSSLSFFNHFPSLTLSLERFKLNGSAPFQDQNLVRAEEIAFGVDLYKLVFESTVEIDEIYVENPEINIKVDTQGRANYNVYKSAEPTSKSDSSSTAIRLEHIEINNAKLDYADQSLNFLFNAAGFNYLGVGNLNQAVFDLQTTASIQALDLAYGGKQYLKDKKVQAELITKINTNSLAFTFEKNDLIINKLAVRFNGLFEFLNDGYFMDISARASDCNLDDLFSALPPEYTQWQSQTTLQGKADVGFSIKGKYAAATNTNPNFNFLFNVRNGLVKSKSAPMPIENLNFKLLVSAPQLNFSQTNVSLKDFNFKLGNGFAKANYVSTGIDRILMKSDVQARFDLKDFSDALNLDFVKLRGLLKAEGTIAGVYEASKSLMPKTDFDLSLKNGEIRSSYYPNPIQNINIVAGVFNKTPKLSSTKVDLRNIQFTFEKQAFTASALFVNPEDISYKIKAAGALDVGRIAKVFKVSNVDGFLDMKLNVSGAASAIAAKKFGALQNDGYLKVRNIRLKAGILPLDFKVEKGDFSFVKNQMKFDAFTARYGSSELRMNGQILDVIPFLFEKDAVLKGNFLFEADQLVVSEWMVAAPQTQERDTDTATKAKTEAPKASGVVVVPANLDITLRAKAQKIVYNDLNLNDFSGAVHADRGTLRLAKTGFDLIGCKVAATGTYKNFGTEKAGYDVRLTASNFDIKRAYNEIELFRTAASSAESASGLVSLDYRLNGVLNENMEPIYPSIVGAGSLTLEDIKVKGLKMFSIVGKKTGSDAVANPDLKKVVVKSSIRNNVITIDRTKFGAGLFRLRFEGKTNFNGQMNLKLRVGLPPFGLIGIPCTVRGTKDNPKIRFFSKKTDETESEAPKESMLIKNDSLPAKGN
ncbi:AsmA family protein [Flavobacterium sp.]|uniref:AsmA family protein n=1 Tax=Flavobacterium sp. TaxID=239 RepID=UPI003B9B2369